MAAFDGAGNQINNWVPPAFPASGHAYAPFEFGYDAAAPVVTGITLAGGLRHILQFRNGA
jgi:hypothetical protein